MRSIAPLPIAFVLTTMLVASTCAWAADGKRAAALVSYGAAEAYDGDVRAALAALSTIALKDKKSTAADVAAAAELGTTCAFDNTPCLASLAVLLRVDVLVVSAGDELAAIDAVRGTEIARERYDAARVRDVVELLLEPHLHYGRIVVNAPSSSSVTVDGAPVVGSTRVRGGAHRVAVTLDQHEPFHAAVDVAAGTEVVVDALLRPITTSSAAAPPPDSAVSGAWIIAASGAGLAVAGGAVALGIDAGLGAGLGSADEKEGYQATGVIALVVASTGVAVAITGAAIALLAGD